MGLFNTLSVTDATVDVHQAVLFPGMTVMGLFSFKVRSETTIRAIRIKLSGRERTHLEDVTRASNNPQAFVATDSVTVVKELLTVAGSSKHLFEQNPDGTPARSIHDDEGSFLLPRGDYVIPFQFILPTGIPSSGIVKRDAQFAKIDYHIKGYLTFPFGSNVTAKAPLHVLNAMTLGQYNRRGTAAIKEPLVVPITRCCCISKGSVALSAAIDKNTISLDRPETIQVALRVDNTHGEEAIKTVFVSFRNAVFYKAQRHTRQLLNCVAKSKVDIAVAAGAFESVVADLPVSLETNEKVIAFRKKGQRPQAISSAAKYTPLEGGVDLDAIKFDGEGGGGEELSSGTLDSVMNSAETIDAAHVIPSLSGHLIESQWHLVIEVDIPFCTTNPTLSIPLLVAAAVVDPCAPATPLTEEIIFSLAKTKCPPVAKGKEKERLFLGPPQDTHHLGVGLDRLPPAMLRRATNQR